MDWLCWEDIYLPELFNLECKDITKNHIRLGHLYNRLNSMILKNRRCYHREKSHSHTIVTLPHYKRLFYKFYALPTTISTFGFIFAYVSFATIYFLLIFFAWFHFPPGIFTITDMGWCCWGCLHWHILLHILTGYR
jgi:hypothetical protein